MPIKYRENRNGHINFSDKTKLPNYPFTFFRRKKKEKKKRDFPQPDNYIVKLMKEITLSIRD